MHWGNTLKSKSKVKDIHGPKRSLNINWGNNLESEPKVKQKKLSFLLKTTKLKLGQSMREWPMNLEG